MSFQLGPIVVDGSLVAHDHVELAGVHEQVADDLDQVQDGFLRQGRCPGGDRVFDHLQSESLVGEDVGDELRPRGAPVHIGRPTLEREDEVVLVVAFAGERLDGGEVKAEPRLEVHEVARNHEVVALRVGLLERGRQSGIAGGLEEDRGQTRAAHGRWSVPRNGDHSVPQCMHGPTGDLVEVDVFALDVLGEAVIEVEHPPLHGHVVVELFRGIAGEFVLAAEGEHLGNRLLVTETGDVVQGLDIGGAELGRVRIEEGQRCDVNQRGSEHLADRASRHEIAALPASFEAGHEAPVNREAVGVHRDLFTSAKSVEGADAEDRRDAELACDGGEVAGDAAMLRDDGRGPVEQSGPPWIGVVDNQDGAVGHLQCLAVASHPRHPAAGGARADADAARDQRFAHHRRGRRLNGCVVHGASLQNHDSTVGAKGPLHILRGAEVFLEAKRDPGDLDGLLVGERRPAGDVLGDLLAGDALPRTENEGGGLVGDEPVDHRLADSVDHEKVGVETTVDHGLRQTDGGADPDPAIRGVSADPRCRRRRPPRRRSWPCSRRPSRCPRRGARVGAGRPWPGACTCSPPSRRRLRADCPGGR